MSAMEKKAGKNNFLTPVTNYFKEVKSELKKVVFPTFKQVRKNTLIVLVVVIIVGVIIAGLDFVFNNARNYVIQNEDNLINQVQQGGDTDTPPIQVEEEQPITEEQPPTEEQPSTEEGSSQE